MEAMLPLLLVLLLASAASVTDANWCVCRQDASPAMLQKAIDYACGAGADCTPLQQNGPCFNPNTLLAHCSYAVNSYFQKKGQAQGSCDFTATATVSAGDPSSGTCSYPSTASAAGTGGGVTPVPGAPVGGGVTTPPFANPPPTSTGLAPPTNPGFAPPTNPGGGFTPTPTNPGLTPTSPGFGGGVAGGGFAPGSPGGGGVLSGGVGLGPSGVSTDGTAGAAALPRTLAAGIAGFLSLAVVSLLAQ